MSKRVSIYHNTDKTISSINRNSMFVHLSYINEFIYIYNYRRILYMINIYAYRYSNAMSRINIKYKMSLKFKPTVLKSY